MEEIKAFMMILTPQNFHQWLKELKGVAEKVKVWEFVDSNDQQIESESAKFLEISDYQVLIMPQSLTSIIAEGRKASQTFVTRSAENYEELSNAQQKSYQMKITVYQMKEKLVKKMTHGTRIINNALKTSTRIYILIADMNAPIRDIIKALIDKYQRSNA